MCQAENKAKKRSLQDPYSLTTACYIGELMDHLPFLLASEFGYHDKKNPTTCSCSNKQDPSSHRPIQLPFALREISKNYQRSDVEESLANIISKLVKAITVNCVGRIPSDKFEELVGASVLFYDLRLFLGKYVLVNGNTELAEHFVLGIYKETRVTKFMELLSSDFVPEVWGRATKHEIDTLVEMARTRQLRCLKRSSLEESEYPLLTRFYDMDADGRDKPPQVGTTWPTLVKGKMSLVVPDGGQCCLLYTSPRPRDS